MNGLNGSIRACNSRFTIHLLFMCSYILEIDMQKVCKNNAKAKWNRVVLSYSKHIGCCVIDNKAIFGRAMDRRAGTTHFIELPFWGYLGEFLYPQRNWNLLLHFVHVAQIRRPLSENRKTDQSPSVKNHVCQFTMMLGRLALCLNMKKKKRKSQVSSKVLFYSTLDILRWLNYQFWKQ